MFLDSFFLFGELPIPDTASQRHAPAVECPGLVAVNFGDSAQAFGSADGVLDLDAAAGVLAGFGARQAKGGGQHGKRRVRFQVIQDEQQLLFRAGQQAYAPTTGPALAWSLPRKAGICFGLAPLRERLG